MLEALGAIATTVANGIYGFFWTILNIGQVLNFSEAENVLRFVYYGGSAELLGFLLFVAALIPGILAAIGYMVAISIWVRVSPNSAAVIPDNAP